MSRRKWFVAHGWIGLTAGLMLFVICWSGTVAVFSSEIDWLLNPILRVPATSGEPNWSKIKASTERAFPDARVLQNGKPLYERFPAEVILLRPGERMWRAYADPTTGRILDDHQLLQRPAILPQLSHEPVLHQRRLRPGLLGVSAGRIVCVGPDCVNGDKPGLLPALVAPVAQARDAERQPRILERLAQARRLVEPLVRAAHRDHGHLVFRGRVRPRIARTAGVARIQRSVRKSRHAR